MERQTFSDSYSGQFLTEDIGEELLKGYGLPVVEGELCRNKEEALNIAEKIGYPVVMKGMSPQIIHKTEANVVKLNISNSTELVYMFDEIEANIKKYDESAEFVGVLVQRMVPKGIELIVGVKKDPIFGHQLLLGTGGIFVDIVKDFQMKMMPVNEAEVIEMIYSLKSYPILNGYRGQKKINFDQLIITMMKLNQVIQSHPYIEEMDLNPIICTENEIVISDARILIESKNNSFKEKNIRSLDHISKMINPKSIAVVGASTDTNKNGGRLFRYIVENGFKGELYPIHPKADLIQGYKAYQSINDIPGEVDLACIIVKAQQVPSVLRQCQEKGIHTAIIYSSGFSEIGEEGELLQQEIQNIALEGNIRILGPNSIGIASPSINVYTAFGSALEVKDKKAGSIGFVSQSGAMGSALLSRSWEQGAGFSRWISVANEADLTISDFINVLADDDKTKVISVFMEAVRDTENFIQATQRAMRKRKPVLIYKTGKSNVGKRAVQSHTGAIAGDDATYSSAFNKLGVLRMNNVEELIDTSRAFCIQPIPKGNRIGIITASGGASSVVADLCHKYGLDVPLLNQTSEKINKMIPPFGSSQNPIDVTAEIIAKPEMFKTVLQTVATDNSLDGVIVMLTTNADPGAKIIAQAILDVFKESNKPIVVGRLGAEIIAPEAMSLYQKEEFPVYSTPERVVSVMSGLVEYGKVLKKFVVN